MYEFHTDIIPDRSRFVNAFHKTTKRKKFSTIAFLRKKFFTAARFYGKNKSGGKFFPPDTSLKLLKIQIIYFFAPGLFYITVIYNHTVLEFHKSDVESA